MAADTAAGQTEFAEFGILGPLEVSRSGGAVPLGGPRQRAVLALLLLEANRVVSMDRLAEDAWDGHPPEGWVTTVQIYVSHLRQALEPDRARGAAGEVLVTRGRGYLLRVDGERLDAARFRTASRPGGRRWRRAGTWRPPGRCARRWACGGVRCWPTWPITGSPGRRRRGWRSCGWPRSRPGLTRTWRWAGTTR
jgi:DNA-binding winged helix-turn-helix (wHTH) protein